MLRVLVAVLGLAAVTTGFGVVWRGLELMGYTGPAVGAVLVLLGLAVVSVTVLSAPQLRD